MRAQLLIFFFFSEEKFSVQLAASTPQDTFFGVTPLFVVTQE